MKLRRLSDTGFATYGAFVDDEDAEICKTLELPWKDNVHNQSCIPPGTYTAHKRPSPKRGYEVYELDHVLGRGNIQIHIGNLPKDTDGCILVGRHFGKIATAEGVIESRDAFSAFMKRFTGPITFEVVAAPEAPQHKPAA